ncbi:UTP11-like, U3 small nucleolar ribonucleoprotein [Perkinsus olseni]|uniref:UTP11-like, U3 small nucleolar ribonucleoprotein n=2 Tax=Perkinsus olseni TaxID=32597 RepID=A0A7J6RAG5_PEROL|nr:UTP11-like, U3 small nucleolar ribonucleoprotein [Perkinsus olseni]
MTAGSGALRHVVARRTHKERHQLASRQKLGLLEKHKDYSKRAKDYHKKEDQLNNLRQKAALRNKDEFYYRMTNSKQKEGDVIHSGAKLDRDQLKLVDTQDLRYVTSRRVIDEKKIEKMKKNLHLLDDFSGQHTIFVDSDDETEGKFDPAVYFDTDERLLGRASNRLTKEQLAKGGSRHLIVRFRCSENTVVPVAASGIQGEASQQYSTLLSLQNRADKLKEVEAELELRKEVRSERGRRKKMVDADGKLVGIFMVPSRCPQRAAVGRSDWGFFESETTVEIDELSGCLTKVLVYHFDEVTRDRYVSICKPLEGADRTKFKCPMAKRMSPSEEVLTQYVLEHLLAKVQGRSTPFRLMELGAGLGIAGFAAVAAIPNGLDVLLTDGDDKVNGGEELEP